MTFGLTFKGNLHGFFAESAEIYETVLFKPIDPKASPIIGSVEGSRARKVSDKSKEVSGGQRTIHHPQGKKRLTLIPQIDVRGLCVVLISVLRIGRWIREFLIQLLEVKLIADEIGTGQASISPAELHRRTILWARRITDLALLDPKLAAREEKDHKKTKESHHLDPGSRIGVL